jgi:hypothetical protein
MGDEPRYLRLRELLVLLGILILIDTQITRVFPRSPQGQTLMFGILGIIGLYLALSGVRVKGLPKFSFEAKLSAVIIVGGLVVVIISRSSQHYGVSITEFIGIAFLTFLGLPVMYYVVREDKSSDRGEIDKYPEKLSMMHRDDAKYYAFDNPYAQKSLKRLEEERSKDKRLSDDEN